MSKSTITIGIILTSFCFASATSAQIVRNPLYDLDYDKLCKLQKNKKDKTSTQKIPKGVSVEDDFWYIKRDHIISTLLSRYPLKLDYNQLNTDGGKNISELISDKLLACEINEDNERICKTDYTISDDLRFKDNTNALRFRRSLLRLFENAETGSATDFIVIRRDPGVLLSESLHKNYKPMLSGKTDDAVINAFITSDQQPFSVVCQQRNPQAKGPAEVTERIPAYDGIDSDKYSNAIDTTFSSAKLGRKIVTLGQKGDNKLLIRNSPSELSKKNGKGLEIGITEAGEKDAIDIDAAIGFKIVLSKTDNTDFSLTPFFAMDQIPTDFKFFNPLEDENGNLTGEFKEDSKKIAFADISVGARFDWEWKGPKLTFPDNYPVSARLRSIAGKEIPGLRLGGTMERFTDNFKGQLGNRFGIDASFPKYFNFPGFRQREELIIRNNVSQSTRKQISRYPSVFEGWALEWDIVPTLDYLDYSTDREPFNFGTPNPTDRLNRDIFDTLLAGGRFEFELLKSNLFGAVAGDSWLSLSGNWTWKHGYDDLILDGIVESNETDAEKFEASIKLLHPDFKGFSFGLSYEVGQNFRNLTDAESLAFTIGTKY